MITNPFTAELATERRRDMLTAADRHRLAHVRTRSVRRSDGTLLRQLMNRLSAATRYARYLYPKADWSPRELDELVQADHRDREALLAVTHSGAPVALAECVRNEHRPTSAEVAIVVDDDWQGLGVGSYLAEHLANQARREGVSELTALMSADNIRARRLLARLGPLELVSRDGPTVTYRVRLL